MCPFANCVISIEYTGEPNMMTIMESPQISVIGRFVSASKSPNPFLQPRPRLGCAGLPM